MQLQARIQIYDKRTLKQILFEKCSKNSVLKGMFWKKFWCNSILIKLHPTAYSLQFYQKQVLARPEWRSAENSDVSTRQHPWWKLLFSKKCKSKVYPCDLKRTPPQGLPSMGSARYLFLIFWKIFCELLLLFLLYRRL